MKKKPHSTAFKFKVAIAAIKGDKTTVELCQEYGIVSSQLFKWKKELLEHGEAVFKHGVRPKVTKQHRLISFVPPLGG